ncbi:MAG TPA: hypothetical protein VD770_00335, partial [Coxiellaceae bacterium]|nr:hypothetical protein [Coxiellaceae bacterium]
MPRTLTDSELKKRQRLALDRTANFILGATVIFALVGGLLLFPASPVFVPLLISLAAVSLAFKWFANPPVTLGRSFLYVAGAAMSVALLATLLTFPPTLGLVIGLTAMVAMSFAIGARFLEKPHSLATDLNPMSKAGYFTMALAFVGLATVFSLMAAGVVPTFIVLPVMAGAAVGA